MATHQSNRCLKKTIEDAEEATLGAKMVLATSVCGAVGGGSHSWSPLGTTNSFISLR